MSKFEKAVQFVLANEGVYSNHYADRGGKTKHGISQNSYPHLNIKELTLAQAIEIYKNDFWDIGNFEKIENANIATKLFDIAVNIGVNSAIRLAQRGFRALGILLKADGILGPKTLKALNDLKDNEINTYIAVLKTEVAGYYRNLANNNKEQKVFLEGWLNRAYKPIKI